MRHQWGASEDFAGTRLPTVLQRFLPVAPEAATIDLKVGISADLSRPQERSRLDLVFGKQCSPIRKAGQLLWKEPLVWASAEDESLDLDEPLPLAVFPDPCIYRKSAITALNKAGRAWCLVSESGSMAGCLPAASFGLLLWSLPTISESRLAPGGSQGRIACVAGCTFLRVSSLGLGFLRGV